jgi:hypothetical protein
MCVVSTTMSTVAKMASRREAGYRALRYDVMQAGDLFSGEPLPFPHDISAHWWAFGAPLGTPFLTLGPTTQFTVCGEFPSDIQGGPVTFDSGHAGQSGGLTYAPYPETQTNRDRLQAVEILGAPCNGR